MLTDDRHGKPYLGSHASRSSGTGVVLDGLMIFRARVDGEIVDVEIPFHEALSAEDALLKAAPVLFEAAMIWQEQAEVYSQNERSLEVFRERETDESTVLASLTPGIGRLASAIPFTARILPVAAFLVGICVALVGLVKLFETHFGPSHVDELGGLLAVLFLVSTLTSIVADSLTSRLKTAFERVAGVSFVSGLVGLTFVSLFFAYDVV